MNKYRLQPFHPEMTLIKPITIMYCQAFNEPPYDIPRSPIVVADTLRRHGTYPGFRGWVAVGEDDAVLGMVYGYQSRPEQFYHKHLAHHLGPGRTREWLHDCFELVELAVSPAARGLGLGRQLHDRILDGLPFTTAVLTTHMEPTRAQSMYLGSGWQIIGERFQLAPELPPYYIMGLELPYTGKPK